MLCKTAPYDSHRQGQLYELTTMVANPWLPSLDDLSASQRCPRAAIAATAILRILWGMPALRGYPCRGLHCIAYLRSLFRLEPLTQPSTLNGSTYSLRSYIALAMPNRGSRAPLGIPGLRPPLPISPLGRACLPTTPLAVVATWAAPPCIVFRNTMWLRTRVLAPALRHPKQQRRRAIDACRWPIMRSSLMIAFE